MRRSFKAATLCSLLSIAVLCIGAVVAAADAAASAVPGQEGLSDTFLGFQLGEERRYIIGPDDAMRDGESVTWSIRLDRVEPVGARAVGVFELGHVESRWGIGPGGSILVEWNYSGEARINEHGFPEYLAVSMYEEHVGESPWRGELMSMEYVLRDGGYVKTVRVPRREWVFDFGVATHDDLDLDVPRGMYLFRPQAAGIDFFMNPGLLGMAIPGLVSEGWRQRVMFFRPTYPVRYPGAAYVAAERDRVAAIRRYYAKRDLEATDSLALEIGGRTLNVRRIEVSGAMRNAFVDEFGRVVRVDLDPDPITRNNRHIRLLFPSEY